MSKPVEVPAELIGTTFCVIHLGNECHALCEIGSADIEQDGRFFHVTASVLVADGSLHRWTMPDSFTDEEEAQELAAALNDPTAVDA